MSAETATDPRIRPVIVPVARPQFAVAEPAARPDQPDAPFSTRGHAGGNRVSDYGPGADHPTAESEFGFADLLDVVNPLQHLPVISSLYRRVTGDEIGTPARIIGATLYGGPPGFLIASAAALGSEFSGEDPGDQVLAALFGPSAGAAPADALAETRPRGEQHPPVAQLGSPKPPPDPAAAEPVYQSRNAQPLTLSAEQELFVERMMTALDKYQAMATPREPVAQPDPGGVDLAL